MLTCFGTNKCSWSRGHLCFKCSSLLAKVQLATRFPIGAFPHPHTPCSLPLSLSCSNSGGLLTLASSDLWKISSDIAALWAHGSTSLDVNKVNKVNGMLAGKAKRLLCNHVIMLWNDNKAARIGVVCQSDRSSPLLACMVTLLLYRKSNILHRSSTFFLEAKFATPPIVLAITAITIYTLLYQQTFFLHWLQQGTSQRSGCGLSGRKPLESRLLWFLYLVVPVAEDAECCLLAMLLHFQAEIKHIIWQTCFTCPQCHSDWSPRGHLPGCFNAPHFLLTRVPFSTPFPNSLAYKQIAACFLICVLSAAFEKFCSNKQGTVTGTSWIFQTYLLPGSMKVPHFCINTGNGISLSCVFLVGCHRSDSDLAIQFVDWCKWLVYLASYWLGSIFRKPWGVFNSSGARLRELCQSGGTKHQGHNFFHSRKNNSRSD